MVLFVYGTQPLIGNGRITWLSQLSSKFHINDKRLGLLIFEKWLFLGSCLILVGFHYFREDTDGWFGRVYKNNVEFGVLVLLTLAMWILVMLVLVILRLSLMQHLVWCLKSDMHCIIFLKNTCLQKYPPQIRYKGCGKYFDG